jgi:hypothetical protein
MTPAERKKVLAEIRFRWNVVDPEKIKIASPKKALEDVKLLLSEIDRRDEALREIAQWHGDKTSIVPSVALKHYAKMAHEALGEE